ncbi:MAG TPA: 1,2-phenylacetyl-CoA epoxidase subunit PaaC [Chitinophagaceae bacterium]|nr:1,2-phenylacetyl-CoA epoxidase subunit PaaC [Chitinophagaceae bacterium]
MEQSSNNLDTSKIPPSGGGGAALALADNALLLGHRNSEWCGHGPVLEQDIAITNISLDLIGQARNFYQYAASLIGGDSNEDKLAYLREAGEFKNCLMVELPRGDWAFTILRQFFFSAYQFYLYQQLQQNKDEQLAAIAVKSIKEVTYHLRWSSEWVIRLGDGTGESHKRIVKAVDELWPYTGELFLPASYEEKMGIDLTSVRDNWIQKINEVLAEATLAVPSSKNEQTGGKEGRHTEHLTDLLKDLQYLQRTYPGMEW